MSACKSYNCTCKFPKRRKHLQLPAHILVLHTDQTGRTDHRSGTLLHEHANYKQGLTTDARDEVKEAAFELDKLAEKLETEHEVMMLKEVRRGGNTSKESHHQLNMI